MPNTYPQGSVCNNGGFSGAATTTVTASLAALPGRVNYITGFDIVGLGATAATTQSITFTGLGGSASPVFLYTFASGATTVSTPLSIRFPQPIPASAANTAIALSLNTGAAGNTNTWITVYGYAL